MIRNGLRNIAGVESLAFDFFNRRLTVMHSLPDEEPIVAALRRVGMEPAQTGHSGGASVRTEVDHRATAPVVAPGGKPMKVAIASRRELVMLGFSGALAITAEVVAWAAMASSRVIGSRCCAYERVAVRRMY